jgi:hypothetical protein
MYENGDVTEEDIFDIGEDEEFNIENIDFYELNEPVDEYDDGITSGTNGTNVSYNGEDWYVFNDYDDAVKAATNDVLMYLDDMGVDGINLDMAKYVDEDWFEDVERESFENYCYDIANEGDDTYDNRLVQECYDEGLIDDSDFEKDEDGEPNYEECLIDTDELTERYVEDHMNSITDFVQEFIYNFGTDEFNDVVKQYNLIDFNELAEDIVDIDGPANSLARYDGDENEIDLNDITYYLYRN